MSKTIISIITNQEKTYEGDLTHYFRHLWQAKHIRNPYHGLRHTLHVLWLCYQGGTAVELDPLKLRWLLIAALFHDWNHSGKNDPDREQLDRAVHALQHLILPEDKRHGEEIEGIMRATLYPHTDDPKTSMHAIIRDADIAQSLDESWIELILVRLADEQGITPLAMLQAQPPYLQILEQQFHTQWARRTFGKALRERQEEVQAMLAVLA